MAIKKVELLVCDKCNCISTGNSEEKISCMECGKTMARVEFVRQPTKYALDGGYAPASLHVLQTKSRKAKALRGYHPRK